MATYYVDSTDGKAGNSGLDREAPAADYKTLNVKPGDKVLFRRGSFIRGKLCSVEGEEGMPVTYGAYGSGEKPTFCGSVSLSRESLWTRESENIWVYAAPEIDEAANLIFNKSDLCGVLRWSKEELRSQGDFWDNCFDLANRPGETPKEHRIYLYSAENPALFYTDIECAMRSIPRLADNGHDIVFENLRFINGGQHGIAGTRRCRNLKIQNCDFAYIGGAVWREERRIRFGNAIECWNFAENVEVRGCLFDNIYDSAVTHQGDGRCRPAERLVIQDNVFFRCGMAAYEQRDMIPKSAQFCGNVCIDAGEGFSGNGVTMPRASEIWPKPMGHHIFFWRIPRAKGDETVSVRNNLFCNAPYGAAVYSLMGQEAEERVELEGNVYHTQNSDLICRWHAVDYRSYEEFAFLDPDSAWVEADEAEKHILTMIRKSGTTASAG